jgi:transcriptional regulator with XRE-family HTH domain
MNLETIGPKIREIRLARGFSQGDVEKRTGLLRCYLSRLENGHTVPSLTILHKIVVACGVTLYEFFDDGTERPIFPALSATDREFLMWVNRCCDVLGPAQKAALLRMIKQFAESPKVS